MQIGKLTVFISTHTHNLLYLFVYNQHYKYLLSMFVNFCLLIISGNIYWILCFTCELVKKNTI